MIPVSELTYIRDRMRDLAASNEKDAKEYLLKDKYHLYLQAKAHKDTNEFWAYRLDEIIRRYEDEDSGRD